MKINQVEELVGITKKNIRFYEEQGLITPERNPENGYRDYNLNDVDRLTKIKLLRKLDIPIEEIRKLNDGELSLAKCLETQIIRLNHNQHNIELMKGLCEKISEEVDEITKLSATEYLSEIKKMEEEGTMFMDIAHEDVKKKKQGPLIAAVVMILFFAAMIGFMIWGNYVDPIPIGFLIFFIAIVVCIIVGIIVALRQRFKEIEGGEEYEARKY